MLCEFLPNQINVDDLFALLGLDGSEPDILLSVIGSVGEGYSNIKSDLDLLVVADTKHKSGSYNVKLLKGIKLEILFYSPSDYLKVLDRMKSLLESFTVFDVDFMHKLIKGKKIYCTDSMTEYLNRFTLEQLNEIAFKANALNVMGRINDVQSFGKSVNDLDFIERVRSLVKCYVDHFLIYNGDTYLRTKWINSRLNKYIENSNEIIEYLKPILINGPIKDDEYSYVLWKNYAFRLCCYLIIKTLFSDETLNGLSFVEITNLLDNNLIIGYGDRYYIYKNNGGVVEVDLFTAKYYLAVKANLDLLEFNSIGNEVISKINDFFVKENL